MQSQLLWAECKCLQAFLDAAYVWLALYVLIVNRSTYQKAVFQTHELFGAHVFVHGAIVRHNTFAIRGGLCWG